MFALEIVMQNVDPVYDIIVPLICACRRFAEVARNLPWESVGDPLYGCKKLRGGIIHGLQVSRSAVFWQHEALACAHVIYGRSFRSFSWVGPGHNDLPCIEIRYRGRKICIDHISANICVYDSSGTCYFGSIERTRGCIHFIREARAITRAVLGMEPAELLQIL